MRNARATGRAELDFGNGSRAVELEYRGDTLDVGRYRAAINRKHPILGRLLQRFVHGTECAFRVRPLAADAERARPLPATAPTSTALNPEPATPVAG